MLRGCPGRVCGWTHGVPDAEPSKKIRRGPLLDDAACRSVCEVQDKSKVACARHWERLCPPSVWHLDHRRKYPKLRGSRRQLPLSPHFRDHCSRSAGPDHTRRRRGRRRDSTRRRPFVLRRSRDPRGRSRTPAHISPLCLVSFQRGEDVGRNLLLRAWRGEEIDWEKIRREYVIEKPCSECREQKEPRGYTAGQWKRDDASRVCKECVGRHEQSGHPWQCCMCKCWQPTAAFRGKWRSNGAALLRVCLNCKETKRCYTCRQPKEEADFSAAAWCRRDRCRQTCKTCSRKERGCWTCASCATSRLKRHFGRYSRQRRGGPHGDQTCDTCLAERDLKRTARRSQERLARTRAKRKQRILAEVWRLVGEMRGTPAGSSNCSRETNGNP